MRLASLAPRPPQRHTTQADHPRPIPLEGPPISKPRTRVLTDDEIRTLWHALDQLPNGVARVIELCLITAQRVGEVIGITPDEIDTPRPCGTSLRHAARTDTPTAFRCHRWRLRSSPKAQGLTFHQALESAERTYQGLSTRPKVRLALVSGRRMT